jgi:hypothetical protein
VRPARHFEQAARLGVSGQAMLAAEFEDDIALFEEGFDEAPPVVAVRTQRLEGTQVGLHVPGVAPGGTAGRLVGLQQHGAHAKLGQVQGQGRPGKAGANDDHIGLHIARERCIDRRRLRRRPATETDRHHASLVGLGNGILRNRSAYDLPIDRLAHWRLPGLRRRPVWPGRLQWDRS